MQRLGGDERLVRGADRGVEELSRGWLIRLDQDKDQGSFRGGFLTHVL